jgi:hypothetical protein
VFTVLSNDVKKRVRCSTIKIPEPVKPVEILPASCPTEFIEAEKFIAMFL